MDLNNDRPVDWRGNEPRGRRLELGDVAVGDLLEAGSDAIALVDEQGRVRYWNRAAEGLFGHTPETALGRPLTALLPPGLLESGELEACREASGPVGPFARRLQSDTAERWNCVTLAPLHRGSGEVLGVAAVFRDVSGEHAREAREHERLGLLSTGLAHEIRNRIAAIHAATQVLASHPLEGEPRRSVFEEIGLEIRQLEATLQDLLHYGRPARAVPRPTDVGDLLRSVAGEAASEAEVALQRLRVEAPLDLRVPIDRALLGRALSHLVHNAAQAMEPGGEILLVARREGPWAVIEVRDGGHGIAPEHLGTIFEPFFTTKARGTGLGLAIARQAVEAHGGALTARPSPGSGATLRIELPLGSPAPPEHLG